MHQRIMSISRNDDGSNSMVLSLYLEGDKRIHITLTDSLIQAIGADSGEVCEVCNERQQVIGFAGIIDDGEIVNTGFSNRVLECGCNKTSVQELDHPPGAILED